MTDGTGKDEEVEDGVHVLALVERVEDSSRDVADTLGHNPDKGGGGDAVEQGLEGHQHTQAHADEAEGLQIGVFLQADEADDGTGQCTRPHEEEQRPAPVALFTQGGERQWRVAAGDVPVDGGMVPTAQALLPLGVVTDGVVDGGGGVARQHAEKIEDNAYACPVVIALEAPHEEDDADDDTQHDAATVGRRVPYLFFFRIAYHNGGKA